MMLGNLHLKLKMFLINKMHSLKWSIFSLLWVWKYLTQYLMHALSLYIYRAKAAWAGLLSAFLHLSLLIWVSLVWPFLLAAGLFSSLWAFISHFQLSYKLPVFINWCPNSLVSVLWKWATSLHILLQKWNVIVKKKDIRVHAFVSICIQKRNLCYRQGQ